MTDVTRPPAAPLSRKGRDRPSLPGWIHDAALVWLVCGSFMGALGPIAPLMVLSGAGALAFLNPTSISGFLKAWPMLIVAALPPLSALWSDQPSVSFRYGIQVTLTVLSIVVAVSAVGPNRYLRGLFIGSFIILVLCILSGIKGQSQGGYVLVGIVGSKNAMGQLCLLLICASLAVLFSVEQPKTIRQGAIGGAALGTAILLQTFATGALLSTLIFVGLAVLIVTASKLSMAAKFLLGLGLILILSPVWLIRDDLLQAYTWFIRDVLHKDPGLTGRDYLWTHADRLIAMKPTIGHGFRSIWLGHSAETVGLLRWAGLSSGIGFNFHNSFREALVDFGFVGALTLATCLGAGLIRLILRATSRGTTAALVFFAAMGVVFIIRSYAETLLGAFGDASLIVFAVSALGYLLPRTPERQNNAAYVRRRPAPLPSTPLTVRAAVSKSR